MLNLLYFRIYVTTVAAIGQPTKVQTSTKRRLLGPISPTQRAY